MRDAEGPRERGRVAPRGDGDTAGEVGRIERAELEVDEGDAARRGEGLPGRFLEGPEDDGGAVAGLGAEGRERRALPLVEVEAERPLGALADALEVDAGAAARDGPGGR